MVAMTVETNLRMSPNRKNKYIHSKRASNLSMGIINDVLELPQSSMDRKSNPILIDEYNDNCDEEREHSLPSLPSIPASHRKFMRHYSFSNNGDNVIMNSNTHHHTNHLSNNEREHSRNHSYNLLTVNTINGYVFNFLIPSKSGNGNGNLFFLLIGAFYIKLHIDMI